MGAPEDPGPVPGTIRILNPHERVHERDGWLLADGSEHDRVERKRLFRVVGTIYGSGDGRTTFNVPDLRSRIWVPAMDAWVNVRGEIKT